MRGNGGGLITAGERLLQVLTPRAIEPERLHFINTPLTARLARDNDFISQWSESIAQAVETGATFSLGFPIDSEEEANRIGQQYHGPVVLITDALCYSTTDIFAAGLPGPRDRADPRHERQHRRRRGERLDARAAQPAAARRRTRRSRPLPSGASFRVSIRRTTRVGERSGVPVEDLGVVPNEVHRMT